MKIYKIEHDDEFSTDTYTIKFDRGGVIDYVEVKKWRDGNITITSDDCIFGNIIKAYDFVMELIKIREKIEKE